MCADNISSVVQPKPARSRVGVFKWISIVIAAFLLLIFFGVPIFLSSSAGTGFIVNKVNQSVDGKIGMGDLNVGWFKGVHLKEFSFIDDDGKASVNVREITAKPHYFSMLSGNISLGKVVIDRPEISIQLQEDKNGSPVTSHKAGDREDSGKKVGLFFNQIDLTIRDGDIKIIPVGGDISSTIHFANIASNIDLKPAGERSKFNVDLDVESKGHRSKISADGNVKSSKKGWSLEGLQGDLTVKVDDLDLATLAPVFALLGKDIDVAGKLNVDVQAKFADGQVEKLDLDAKLEGFKHVAAGKEISLNEPLTLKGRVSTKYGKVNIEDVKLSSSFCNITGKGTGSELDYVAKLDVARTMDFLGTFVDLGEYSFTGSCYEEGKISFSGDTIRFSDHSSIDNFVMTRNSDKGKTSTPMVSAKFTFDMTVDIKKGNLKIDFLTMKTTDSLADIRIDNSVFTWAEDAKEKIDMKVKADVDLAKSKPFAMFFEALPEKMDLAGRVKTELLVKFGDQECRIQTNKTTIQKLRVAAKGVEEVFEDELVKLAVDMRIADDKKSIAFKIDGTKIDLEGNFVENVKGAMVNLSGDVVAKYDLSDASAIASAYLPEGLKMEGNRSDVFTFKSQYPRVDKDKMMENMNATARLGFDRAKYMGMKIGKTDLAINVKDGMLNIAPFTTVVNQGNLNFAGSIDLTKKPMVFTTPKPMKIIDKVHIDDEMGKALLKYLNPLFAQQSDLSGVVNFSCEKLVLPLGGDALIADSQLIGTIAISDMKMKSKGLLGDIMSRGLQRQIVNADMLPSKFILDKGVIRYDDMQVNIDKSYPINFNGAVNLNMKPGLFENMYAVLPYELNLRKGGFNSVKVGETHKTRIKLPIEGTVDNPRINWKEFGENILKKATEGLAEELLQKELDRYLKKKNGGSNRGGSGKSVEEQAIESLIDLFK